MYNYISVLWGIDFVYNLDTRGYEPFYVIKNFRLQARFERFPVFTQNLSDYCVTGCYPVNMGILNWLRQYPNDAINPIPTFGEVA